MARLHGEREIKRALGILCGELLGNHRESVNRGSSACLSLIIKKTASGLFLNRSPSMKYPFADQFTFKLGI